VTLKALILWISPALLILVLLIFLNALESNLTERKLGKSHDYFGKAHLVPSIRGI